MYLETHMYIHTRIYMCVCVYKRCHNFEREQKLSTWEGLDRGRERGNDIISKIKNLKNCIENKNKQTNKS